MKSLTNTINIIIPGPIILDLSLLKSYTFKLLVQLDIVTFGFGRRFQADPPEAKYAKGPTKGALM